MEEGDGRREIWEAMDVSWGGNEGYFVTLLSDEFGEVEVWEYMSKGKPWKHHYVKLGFGCHGWISQWFTYPITTSIYICVGDEMR